MNPLFKRALSRPTWALEKAYLLTRSYWALRKDDIVLALFPKTGSTWTRYFLFHLLHLVEGGEDEETLSSSPFKMPDHSPDKPGTMGVCAASKPTSSFQSSLDAMNEVMPEFAHRSLFNPWPFQSCPRLIKTHRVRNPLLSGHRTVMVIRDPRDVVVSYYHYALAKKQIHYQGSIKEVIHHPEMGLKAFFYQFHSWKDQADLMLRYEDLKTNPQVEFKRLVDYLGIPADEAQIRMALEQSDMNHMRKAQETSQHFKQKFSEGFVFARSGQSGQWKGLFDEADIAYWERLKKENDFFIYDT